MAVANSTRNQAAKLAAGQKLNRWQKLLTAEQARQLPDLYSQDGKGLNAIAYAKFFAGGMTWFATEFDPSAEFDPAAGCGPQLGQFFGLVISPDCPDGELGYFAACELCARQVPSGRRLPNGRLQIIPVVERDLHFRPKSLLAAFQELTGREHPSVETAGKICAKCGDKAATQKVGSQPLCDQHAEAEWEAIEQFNQ